MENHSNLSETFTEQRNTLRIGGKGRLGQAEGNKQIGFWQIVYTLCKVHPLPQKGLRKTFSALFILKLAENNIGILEVSIIFLTLFLIVLCNNKFEYNHKVGKNKPSELFR